MNILLFLYSHKLHHTNCRRIYLKLNDMKRYLVLVISLNHFSRSKPETRNNSRQRISYEKKKYFRLTRRTCRIECIKCLLHIR
jgi:hypothetical protein